LPSPSYAIRSAAGIHALEADSRQPDALATKIPALIEDAFAGRLRADVITMREFGGIWLAIGVNELKAIDGITDKHRIPYFTTGEL
jgi:hypothetical protein